MWKRKAHHVFRSFRRVKPIYFLILAAISTVICIYGLRGNNEHMASLRAELYSADQNNGDVQGALNNLRSYVTTHMNTNLSSGPNAVYPPIQLKYTYNRIVAQEAQTLANQNSSLYTNAEAYCQQQIPTGFSGRYRVPCIESYITSHNLQSPTVEPSLYEFDFISPTWSPDMAGWSLVAAVLFGFLFTVSLLAAIIFKRSAK